MDLIEMECSDCVLSGRLTMSSIAAEESKRIRPGWSVLDAG